MIEPEKIIWAEGVFLGQQHFQLWDRNVQAELRSASRRLTPFHWGLLSVSIDEKAIADGTFRLLSCEFILPTGERFHYAADGADELSFDLRQSTGTSISLFLARPSHSGVTGISDYPSSSGASAWAAHFKAAEDEYDTSRTREVLLARPQFLLVSSEEAANFSSPIKIAEIDRLNQDTFQLSATYIPPVIHCGAAPELMRLLHRLIDTFTRRIASLQNNRHSQPGIATSVQRDTANFLFLQNLLGTLPLLKHCQRHSALSPENLYTCLAQCAGTLSAYQPSAEGGVEIPGYEHQDLRQTFSSLESLLQRLISRSLPSATETLHLQQEREGLYSLSPLATEMCENSTLFLEVPIEGAPAGWTADFARQVKISSRETIDMVLASALPGVQLLHTQRPPSALTTRSGYEYFRLEPAGQFWEQVLTDRSLAIYLPRSMPVPSIELISIQETP